MLEYLLSQVHKHGQRSAAHMGLIIHKHVVLYILETCFPHVLWALPAPTAGACVQLRTSPALRCVSAAAAPLSADV